MGKRISVRLSGVYNNENESDTSKINGAKNGRTRCSYIYITSDASAVISSENLTYEKILTDQREYNPILITYEEDSIRRVNQYNGLYGLSESGNSYSFYRREYEEYERTYYDPETKTTKTETKTFEGEWKPVAVNVDSASLRDFNITNGRTYQYILYPNYTAQKQQYGLSPTTSISLEQAHLKGDSFSTNWYEWSLVELIPLENEIDAPIVKKTYKADVNNIWLFKYGLNTGSETQNLSKTEISTLGTYPKIGYGIKNYISGDVSCYLGSEIVPYDEGYIERMRDSIKTPLSTNEKVRMLEKWRKIVYSKNPKLLKDIKGQSWIVQIFSGSNTTNNFYRNQPDTISFSWKQIEDPENCIIYGSGEKIEKTGECDTV